MKKIIALLTILTISMGLPVNAKEGDNSINDDIIIIRENVSHEEALHDPTYNVTQTLKSTNVTQNTESVSWDVWGERVFGINGSVSGYTPVGYSAHMDGSTVLETYHYTRTYFGVLKRGDSGRCWGHYTVKATGTFCDEDTSSKTQYVKYGTEE